MNNNFEDILNKEESNYQQGLNDLNDALSSDELVSQKSNDDFDKDAAEGLQKITGNKLSGLANEINRNLKSQLKNKKRVKKKSIDQSAVIVIIITLLIIIVLAYIIIKKFY